MSFDLDNIVRENVRRLVPYSSARDEFGGSAEVLLDANENSFGSPLTRNYNRYPDPRQVEIKKQIAELNNVKMEQIFVGNGSDEAIDLLFRIFCRPRIDNVIVCPPTYGMYEVAADINDTGVRRANLTPEFQLDRDLIRAAVNENTKLIFLCSPNNPTGNLLRRDTILEVAGFFNGVVVVDEAYIHFSNERSLAAEIEEVPNLVVLQTFSKAWGLAGLRVGLALAGEEIIKLFNKVKPPYNVSQVAQELILAALGSQQRVTDTVEEIIRQRNLLADGLSGLTFVKKIYRSDANFLLVKTTAPNEIYAFLVRHGVVVRNRSNVRLCEGCLRVTVGTPEENGILLDALEEYEKSLIH
jgi:histidinol-phosphate aminotransferase